MKTLEIMDRIETISDLLSLPSTPPHPHVDSAIAMLDLLIGELKRDANLMDSHYDTQHLIAQIDSLHEVITEMKMKINRVIERHHLREFNTDVVEDLEELMK